MESSMDMVLLTVVYANLVICLILLFAIVTMRSKVSTYYRVLNGKLSNGEGSLRILRSTDTPIPQYLLQAIQNSLHNINSEVVRNKNKTLELYAMSLDTQNMIRTNVSKSKPRTSKKKPW